MAVSDTQFQGLLSGAKSYKPSVSTGIPDDQFSKILNGAKAQKQNNQGLQFSGAKTGVGKFFQGAGNIISGIGTGIGRAIGQGGFGLAKTAENTTAALMENSKNNPVTGPILNKGAQYIKNKLVPETQDIEKKIFEDPYAQQDKTTSEKIGNTAGSVAPFFETGGPITEAQKVGTTLAEKVPTAIGKFLTKKAAQVIPEAVTTGATQYALSGGDKKSAVETGLSAGILSGLTHIGSDVFSSLIPQTVKDNVSGALKFIGKIGLKGAAEGQKVNDAVSAFTTIHNLSPDISVVDKDGITKKFDPTKTDFQEMAQALYQAKNKIYETYSDLATKAGDQGANFGQKEFEDIKNTLGKYSGKGYTPAFTNKASQIIESLDRFGTVDPTSGNVSFKNTSPAEIQQLIENINQDVNPLSDKAGAQVANEASSEIRKVLDSKISEATGNPEYQKLRDAYSQLKSIEPDILNQFKKAMRGSGVGSDVLNGLSVIDSAQGVLTGSPTEALRGGLIGAVKKGYEYLSDPAVKMRRAFQMLEDASNGNKPSVTTQRLFGK